MFRTTLMTAQTRRCSATVAAAAAAALVLAPGAAFAAGTPAGPETGHASGHTGGQTGGHKGGRTGHSTSHPASHSTSHSAGHAGTGHASRTTGHGGGHSASHTTSGRGTAHGTKAAAHRSGTGSGTGAGSGADAGSMSGDRGAPQHKTSGPNLADTVTKLAVSKGGGEDGSVIMVARVSAGRRGAMATTPTGTVVFSVDGITSEPVPLNEGRALVKAELGPGEHVATAKYSGDGEHAPSSSGPVTVMGD